MNDIVLPSTPEEDLLDGVPAEARDVLVQQVLGYRGPLPLPEDMVAYEKAHPGTAERILSMAERNQAARIKDKENERRHEGWRLWAALMVSLLVIGVCGVLAFLAIQEGQPMLAALATALAAMGTVLTTLKALFRRR